MELSNRHRQYIRETDGQAMDLLLELARIPAPSNHEEQRAAFCKTWLEEQGAEGVYIDEALNVVWPIGCGEGKPIAAIMAHSDVVFLDETPLPLKVEDGRICCPGIGDDTANAVALLMCARYIAQNHLQPGGWGVLLVINSGEEGLGNLKGCRKIMEDYGHRIQEFITFDAISRAIVDRAVGSHRYEVEVRTKGGHSFNDFGTPNAIAQLASLIEKLYRIPVPPKGKTTYNVGVISGGTSVNTIAQQAKMLYEFRSDEQASLRYMQEAFERVIGDAKAGGMAISVTQVGDRPCGGYVDAARQQALKDRAARAIRQHFELEPVFHSGSTDCNVPLSMGIPSVCVGCCLGSGAHTREEFVETESLAKGRGIAMEMVLHYFSNSDI